MTVSKSIIICSLRVRCFNKFLICISVFLSTSAGAYDWSNDYTISTTVTRDDNFSLTEDDPIETTSTDLGLDGDLRGADEVSSIRTGIGARWTDYSESSIEDTEYYNIFLETQRKGERWLAALDLGYALEPTTETELLDTGNRVDGERKTLYVAPAISYQLDEKNSIYANFTVNDVSYDTVSLTGYTDNSIGAGWVHSLDEVSQVSLNGQLSKYDPEDGDTTDISSVNVGYDISTSPATQYSFRLGYADRDTPFGSDRDGDSSIEVQHSLDERNSFSLFAGNGYEASGGGEARYTSRLNLRWSHALAERTQFDLTVEGLKTDDRDYAEIVAGGSHQLTRNFGIAANYRYRIQNSGTDDADSNSVLLSLRYSPVSRWSHEL